MRYQIDKGLHTPAYLQLYECIKEDIIDGVYPHGTKLPSKRILSEELDLSLITVSHALALLDEEGYIESRERSGFFVIYQSEDFIEQSAGKASHSLPSAPFPDFSDADPVVYHSIGEISYNMLAKTMRRTLLDYGERILIKSPSQGLLELRREISSYLSRNRGIYVDPGQIVVGSGAEYLYSLIAQLFDKTIPVAVEDPCYQKIPQVYEAMGHPVEHLRMGKNGLLSQDLDQTTAGLLHVTPFHSYPSQITADISKKNEYIRWSKKGGYIIEENYDSEITVSKKMENPLFSLDMGERTIYLNTFSRTIAPSLRMGYMVLPLHLVDRFHQKLGFYSCTVPVFEQYVLTELLSSGEYERHINRVRRNLRKRS